jgi:hypothetical protein
MRRFFSRSVLVLVVCASFVQSANGQSLSGNQVIWEPPAWTFDELPKATVSKQMLTKLNVSGFPVALENTKMDDVASTLGGKIGQKGDAGNFEEWLCFHGRDANGRWVLWLESGEIDGGTVGSFHWRRLNKGAVLDRRCQALGEAKVELPIALRLDLTEAEVLKSLGRPTIRHGDSLSYVHEHQESIRSEPYVSVNIVVILIRAGRVWSIEVSKTTTS